MMELLLELYYKKNTLTLNIILLKEFLKNYNNYNMHINKIYHKHIILCIILKMNSIDLCKWKTM